MHKLPPAFFVTGTDTGIGKTVISALLTQGLNGTYWKPVQSGLEEETDTQFVQRVTNISSQQFVSEQYRLTEPLSPHASAAIDGIEIEFHKFELPDFETGHLVVEGAGGLMVPLNNEYMIIDLIKYLNLPVLLVSRSELGTLNHTFLSLEALRSRSIDVLGVIMNGPKNDSNRRAIEKYGNIRVLAEIEPLQQIDAPTLQKEFEKHFPDL
ncbi:dethiobiotin synthase [Halalkalibaculum sp. DA3122]|uniref:dethiobiotin synthase n=1 Tax=unclassified Halalkalibaculum TaxID=2964617 RepID=UPI003754C6F5